MKKSKTFSMFLKIISLNRKYFIYYFLLLLASIFVAVFGVVWSEAFRRMVNGATSGEKKEIYFGFALAICVFIIDSTTQLLSSYFGNKLDNIATLRLQKRAMDSLLHASLSNIMRKDSNYYISVINQYIPAMQQTANKKIRDLLGMIVTLIVTIIYLLYIDIILTIGVLIISTLMPLLLNLFSKYISKQHALLKDMVLDRDYFLQDVTQAPIEVRQFNLEKYFLNKLKKLNDAIIEKGHKLFCVESAINRINTVSNYLCIIFILAYGGYRVYCGYIELGDIVAFLYSSVRIFNPLPALVSSWVSIQSTLVKAQDVFEILDFDTEEKKINVSVSKCDIIVKNLSFSYGEKKVLKNINTVFEKGKITAIVGANGSGKSTLIKIMLGLYSPEKGDILFDEISINNINTRTLINYVPQQSRVFSASIKDNILLGNDAIPEKDLVSAIEIAALKDFIKEHNEGIDYVLKENGSNVSGGELQRICIARALVRNKPILILDEHTANVDGINEETIVKGLEHISHNKTIIVIAHKIETIKRADKIVYMSEGEIKETGGFDELLLGDGEFKKFVESRLTFEE